MIKYLFLTLLGISSTFYAQDTLKFTDLYGDYLGQTPPGDTPVAFAPGFISGKYQEHGFPAFSPEGNEVFWQTNRKSDSDNNKWIITCKTMKRIENRWTEPEDISFISSVFSPDVKKLFTSILYDKIKEPQILKKNENEWINPKPMGLVTRFPELKFVYHLSISGKGTLSFVSDAEGLELGNNFGIYYSEYVNGDYARPELLPQIFNMPGFFNITPYIAQDECFLVFASTREGSSKYDTDLFVSFRQPNGIWGGALNLGDLINTNRQERYPALSPDGKYLLFTRDNPTYDEDIFWVSAKIIDRLREQYEETK